MLPAISKTIPAIDSVYRVKKSSYKSKIIGESPNKRDKRAEIYAINSILKKFENKKFEELTREMLSHEHRVDLDADYVSDDSSVVPSPDGKRNSLRKMWKARDTTAVESTCKLFGSI